MRIDLAQDIFIGDIIYNCFMDQLIVTSIKKDMADNRGFHRIVFETIDNNSHKANYSSDDVYFSDLYGESDDEKSWVGWAKENRDFFEVFDHIETMKEIYKIGFCNGFEYRRKISFEEMMQK
jgi:hypothetical protein